MDIKSFTEAYASIYESKKKDDEKPKKWHDDDGDGISYEDGEVDGKFDKKKKKKKDDDEKEVKEHHQKDSDGNVVEHEEIEEAKDCCKECGSYEHKTKDCPKVKVVGETLIALLDTLEEGAEIDKFDAVLAYLIDEQIAEDFDAANKAMTSLSESLVDEIFEQQKKIIAWEEYSSLLVWEDMNKGYTVTAADKKGNTPAWQGYKAGKKKKDGSPLYKAADHLKSEGYQRNPEKGEAEERKRSKRVRGERTPMPPRGDKRREDFEKWYAANVR